MKKVVQDEDADEVEEMEDANDNKHIVYVQ
jgi:hypothetical protein